MIFSTLFKASMKTQFADRTNFFVDIFASGLSILSDFILIVFLLGSMRTIKGWTLAELAFIYGITEGGWGFFRLFGEGLHNFEDLIVTGKFDTFLLRPVSPIIQIMLQKIDFKRAGIIIQAVAVGLWGIYSIKSDFSLVFWFFLLMFFSVIMTFEINIFLASIAFWTTRNKDIIVLAFYSTKNASYYPADIYNRLIRGIITFIIPVATTGYYPLSFLTGKSGNVVYLASPAIACTLLILPCAIIWNTGLKKYTGSGT